MKVCPICQKEYKQLSIQHFIKHGFKDTKEVKNKFCGIDLGNEGTKKTVELKIIKDAKNKNCYCKHYKDKNRKNNKIDNLEITCPTCHAEEHLGFHLLPV